MKRSFRSPSRNLSNAARTALCDLLTGHTSRPVVFLLEPAELELTLTPLDGGMMRLGLRIFESRLRTSDVDAVFEFEGEPTEIALAFWRALRRLQTDLPEADFEEGWRDPFPALEMASLTELLSQRGLVLERNRRT